jgi:hypothetical protein
MHDKEPFLPGDTQNVALICAERLPVRREHSPDFARLTQFSISLGVLKCFVPQFPSKGPRTRPINGAMALFPTQRAEDNPSKPEHLADTILAHKSANSATSRSRFLIGNA